MDMSYPKDAPRGHERFLIMALTFRRRALTLSSLCVEEEW